MKRSLILLVLGVVLLVMPYAASANGDSIDLSNSRPTITSATTFQIRGITVTGWPGLYWADFKWDPATLSFVLVRSGEDGSTPTGTWKITYMYSFTSIFDLKLTRNSDRTFTVEVTSNAGVPYFYYDRLSFSQAGKTFRLTGGGSDSTASFIQTAGSPTGEITVGNAYIGTIKDIPSWFIMSNPFTITYEQRAYSLQ